MSQFYVRTLACVAVMAAAGALHAASPNAAKTAAREDAEAERQTILRTADDIQTLQAMVEATRAEAAGLKADIAKLQQETAELRDSLAKSEETRIKERDALIAKVAELMADKPKPTSAKKANDSPAPEKPAEVAKEKPAPKEKPPAKTADADTPAPAKKPKASGDKGYSHVVQKGETLTMIAEAYQDQKVNVTVADIRKANGLTGDALQIGQKLFIPKK